MRAPAGAIILKIVSTGAAPVRAGAPNGRASGAQKGSTMRGTRVVLLLGIGGLACTGGIEGGRDDEGGVAAGTAARPGAGARPGPGGGGTTPGTTPASAGAPAGTAGASPAAAAAPPPVWPRLTEAQVRNSLAEIFGSGLTVPDLDPDLRIEGLPSLGASKVATSPAGVSRYEALAESVARQVMGDPSRRARWVKCAAAAAPDRACAGVGIFLNFAVMPLMAAARGARYLG